MIDDTKVNSVLPDTLGELMDVALKDLESVEQDPRYMVHMGIWHEKFDGKCAVCFAGAVIARTLDAPIELCLEPHEYPPAIEYKLDALNAVRSGFVDSALQHFHGKHSIDLPHVHDRTVPLYFDNPNGFKEAMRSIADELKGLGI